MSDLVSLKAKLDQLQGKEEDQTPIQAINYSPAYKRREDMSYVKPGVDDEDYEYDSKNSYGVVIRPEKPPELVTDFAQLLRSRDLDKLQYEINKLEDRCVLLSGRDQLADQVARHQVSMNTLTSKLNGVLEKCRVRITPRPGYIAPEPRLGDDKLLEVPMWWKRAEDDAETYHHRYQCFSKFQELQAILFDYNQRLSMTQGLERLEKIVYRLEHEYTEAQGVAALIGQVDEAVEVVLNEAERSWQDERSVYELAKAVTIDEIKSKQSNEPSSRLTRKDGQKFPAVLNIPVAKQLPCDEAIAKLRTRYLFCTQEAVFQDMADAAHVWLGLRDQAAEARQQVHHTNETREGRRLATEAHYGRVRDVMTAQTLTLTSIREAYGTMGSL